ncbi:MAG: citrate lyase acyl carrier protein [Spirochaetaceae bacterium]|nr:citrate lyase acyl carrier protein [Spirochaetaceae bacterium]
MEVTKQSVSGTLESSDIMITIEKSTIGNQIELNSTVEKQFGDSIRKTINTTLREFEINNAKVGAIDKGALDCIIIARLKAAIYHSVSDEDKQSEVFKA